MDAANEITPVDEVKIDVEGEESPILPPSDHNDENLDQRR